MQLKPVIIEEKDLEEYRALRSVIRQGQFDLQGSAIFRVAELLLWYDKFEVKMQDVINKQKIENKPKVTPMKDKPKVKK